MTATRSVRKGSPVMNIHEYQAKKLLANYGVATLKGGVAYTADEAEHVAKELGGPIWVVSRRSMRRYISSGPSPTLNPPTS